MNSTIENLWSEWRPKQKRPITAFLFEGSFPLAFLRKSESVRAGGLGSVEILAGNKETVICRLRVGEYLVRYPDVGLLAHPRDAFEYDYEEVEAQ